MHTFIFRTIFQLRQNYWFWPSAMTFAALLLGFLLPFLDSRLGSHWMEAMGFIGPVQVEGARAILTTLAGAILGVAGVAFSITIVAVAFASSNYGPRLIGNFMADRTNQVVLGVFVATFVYCITVLTTIRAAQDMSGETLEPFVPQISILFAILLTLGSVGALIGYIHHVPESINIMNLTASIGRRLRQSVIAMLEEGRCADGAPAAVHVSAWDRKPAQGDDEAAICTVSVGYVQWFDLKSLDTIADETGTQISLNRAPGDFMAAGECIMTVSPKVSVTEHVAERLQSAYQLGANRTDEQDILFVSDLLVEVLVRALSPGVNDPHTAILCLDWLRAGLATFARSAPPEPEAADARVRYSRITFEAMMTRSLARMRQHVAADRTVTLHALGVLRDLALAASDPAMSEACVEQMRALARSAHDLLGEELAREEVTGALSQMLRAVDAHRAANPWAGLAAARLT